MSARTTGLVLGSILCSAIPGPAHQVLAQVATDGRAGPRLELAGPHFQIGAELGSRAGGNLFHSFERFSIETGGSATFTGPNDVQNVISRVTGGARSDIDGTLRSTIPGADFFFINPAGVVFGPNASLDVRGSFHVSTADELRFSDGAVFSATDPDASSLTVAAPEAFGFLGAAPASIAVDRSFLFVPDGEALSIVGGHINITGGSGLREGLIGGEGRNTITLAALGKNTSFFPLSGTVVGGNFRDITMRSQAGVGALNEGTVRVIGRNVTLNDSDVLSIQFNNPDDAPALISIRAGILTLTDGSDVAGDVRCIAGPCSPGRGADIEIHADQVWLLGEATIASATFEDKPGGNITIDSDLLVVIGRVGGPFAGITTGAQTGSSAPAGNISIVNARLVLLADDGEIASSTFGSGPAGDVTVDADILQLVNGGQIEASTFTDAPGGQVAVEAKEILITGSGGSDATAITAFSALGSGPAGEVTIRADVVKVTQGGVVATFSLGGGAAGAITVEADAILVQNGSVSSDAGGDGPAGTIILIGRDRIVVHDARIGTTSSRSGGGQITLRSAELVDLRSSDVTTNVVSDASATAGNVAIDPRILIIDRSVISANARGGQGGNITIVAGDRLQSPDSNIEASGVESGTIDITTRDQDVAGQLVVLDPALLDAASLLRERCAARRDVGASSFTGVGRGGLPPGPDQPLMSDYTTGGVPRGQAKRSGDVTAESALLRAPTGRDSALLAPVLLVQPCAGVL